MTFAILRTTVAQVAIDGSALKILREKDGYSLSAFALKVGVSLSYLMDIESGRRTLKRNPGLIKRMAEALDVPMSMISTHAPGEAVGS